MNVTESNNLRYLLHWLLGTGSIPSESARDAAAALADRSYQRLMTGLDGERVRELWPATNPADDRAALDRVRALREHYRASDGVVDGDLRANELDAAIDGTGQ